MVGLVAEGQAVLRLLRASLALGVVQGPLVEADHGLPRLLDHLLAELDRLGEHDLLFGGQQGDLADLLEVHPDRVVDPDHVRRERVELLRRRFFELGRVELGRFLDGRQRGARDGLAALADHLDADLARVIRVELQFDVVVLGIDAVGVLGFVLIDRRRATRSETRELRLLQLGLATPRACQHGLDELLIERVAHASSFALTDV